MKFVIISLHARETSLLKRGRYDVIGWNIKVRKRLVLLFYLTILLFICLAYRLVSIQAFQNEKYRTIADNQHKGIIEIPALRGSILERKI